MRIFPILLALLVMGALYMLVFEREAVTAFAGREPAPETETAQPASEQPASEQAVPEAGRVSVVAVRSEAERIERVVLVRGRTEAARQVDVRSETTGQVVSDPLRKGAFVSEGELLCRLDPGTREVGLAEAEARLSEAETRLPEAEARVAEARARRPEAEARLAEAEARLVEAEINDRAASKLSEGGFASETRVAGTRAAVEAARAGVQAAKSQVQGADAGVQSALSQVEAAKAAIRSAEAAVAGAKKEIERLSIRAPFEGLLESDAAELGSLLQPGALCATIVQLDPIKLVGFVAETEVDRIAVGRLAGARLATGREVQGRVTFLSRSADPNTRTFRVEVEVPNPGLAIRDGQTAEIVIRSEGQRAHLLPLSALTLDDDGRLGVRLVDADRRAAFAQVEVLRDSTSGVYLDGLPETAEVIVVGQEFVSDGVPVEVSYRGASE